MDHSQNSDILLENNMIDGNPSVLKNESYKCILKKIKKFFSTECTFKEPMLSLQFSSYLEDCNICITQCLETVVAILEDAEIQLNELHSCMEDAISLLQMLSYFVKNIIESIAMSCGALNTFPTTLGLIILTVFTHCKNSEDLYGNHLNTVEPQLKGLFRTCHELQLTYLMVLEKHFIFDMEEKEQQYVLLKALDINLRIGEIVQALDVKTMAEQWKAYTAICEKYSKNLMDKNIYNQCTELLCNMIEYSIKSALEDEQDKIVLRALKVASFTIKILSKVSNIFRHGTLNNYNQVLQLIIHIHMCDGSILEGMSNKSQHFIGQLNLLILNTTQSLLSQLLCDERFFNCMLQFDIRKLDGDKQPGYILFLISTIKCILQMAEDDKPLAISKNKLIDCVFNIIPYSHVCFKMGLKFKINDGEQRYGFEEHLLAHMVALSMSMNSEEFSVMEHTMFEIVISNNCANALFSSRLWTLLARLTSPQYKICTVMSLCKIYKKLETNALFHYSPQGVHLANTLTKLFEILPEDAKVMVYKQFDIQDESNYSLWCVLKINNLPENIRLATEETILDKLSVNLNGLIIADCYIEQDMQHTINLIKISSTCSLEELNSNFEDCVVKAWIKACPKKLLSFSKNIGPGIYWYYAYVEALISLTDCTIEQFFYFENAFKVFHILSNLILTGNMELTLLSLPIFCKISLYLFPDEDNSSIDSIINVTFKYLLIETEFIEKMCTLCELVKYREQKKFEIIVMKIILGCSELQEKWSHVLDASNRNCNYRERKEQLILPLFADGTYIHKCVENKIELEDSVLINKAKSQSNFDLDIDHLFDGGSDPEEPANKKPKLDVNETEVIVKRLEDDSLSLSRATDLSNEWKKRIAVIYDRLKNIIS